MCRKFPFFFCLPAPANTLARPLTRLQAVKRHKSWTWDSLLCRYSAGPGIAKHKDMLSNLKRRCPMSPLLLMLLLSLVPFPVLAIAVVADRWMKATHKAVS